MPYPWTANDILTASDLNNAINNSIVTTGLTLDTYVPTLVQGATPTKTVEYASYHTVAGMTHVVVALNVTSAGTAANAVVIGVPVAMSSYRVNGVGAIYDASANIWYSGVAVYNGATTVTIIPHGATSALGGTGFTAALASGDKVCLNLQYL